MQSIKQWHTPPDRAHNQHCISIHWSIDTPVPVLLQFIGLYITHTHVYTHTQKRYQAAAQAQIHTPALYPPRAHTHRQDWLAYFTRRGEKCSITEMSRCFKEEICFGTQQQLMKCDLEFFFFHFFVASEIMNGAGSGEKKKQERG